MWLLIINLRNCDLCTSLTWLRLAFPAKKCRGNHGTASKFPVIKLVSGLEINLHTNVVHVIIQRCSHVGTAESWFNFYINLIFF